VSAKTRATRGGRPNPPLDDPIRAFSTQDGWAAWLEKNHRQDRGLWLRLSKRLSKKDAALPSLTYAEALEVALCYGWIDGQKRPESEKAWLQRFVPRAPKSIWSKINRDKANKLIASGQMKAAGLDAIEAAKKDGRWEAAYDSPKAATVPADLQSALDAAPAAKCFFETLDRANRYAILFRVQTVKKVETRVRKIREFVEMLEKGEKIHEPRQPKRKSR
jgi:uncharacterized protein YdeI (YjbR/CyaY-like superfamily)